MGVYRDIIVTDGYTVIPKFFNNEEVYKLQELNYNTEPEKGHHKELGWQAENVYPREQYQHYWSQQCKEETIWIQEKLHPIISDMLLETYKWFAVDFHVANPGSDYIHAHIDSPYQFRPWHDLTDLLAVQCLIAVDEFSFDNGGTAILPGSHKEHYPLTEIGSKKLNDKLVEDGYIFSAPQGSILIYHPRSLHSTMPNFTTRPRTALLMLAVRPDIYQGLLSYHLAPKKKPCMWKKEDSCTRWPICVCKRTKDERTWNSAGQGNIK